MKLPGLYHLSLGSNPIASGKLSDLTQQSMILSSTFFLAHIVPCPMLYFSFPQGGFCFMSMILNAWHHEGGGHLFAESHSPRNFLQSGWTVSFQASPQYTFNSIAVPIKMFVKAARRGLGPPRGGGDGQVQQKKRVNIYAQCEDTCCAHSMLLSKAKVLYKSIMLLSIQPSHR